MTATIYPDEIEILSTISKSEDITPTKLIGGYISHDNCAMANKTGDLLMDLILALGKAMPISFCFRDIASTSTTSGILGLRQ